MWMFWVMALAIVGLFGTLVQMYTSTRAELREKEAIIMAKDKTIEECSLGKWQAEREFRAELSALYKTFGPLMKDIEREKRRRR